MTQPRRLRSGDEPRADDLFNFEPYLRDKIPVKMPLYVSLSRTHTCVPRDTKDPGLDKVKLGLKREIEVVHTSKRRSVRPRSKLQQKQYIEHDLLGDSRYLLYHSKMEREEKKMQNYDKVSLLTEYDKLQNQLDTLNYVKYKLILERDESQLHNFLTNGVDDIPRKLAHITRLNDINNYQELKIKYKLTVKEILDFLKRYEALKKKELDLKLGCDEDDSDEENDMSMDVARLRHKRLVKRNLTKGAIVKFKFSAGETLVIDPINPPKFVKK